MKWKLVRSLHTSQFPVDVSLTQDVIHVIGASGPLVLLAVSETNRSEGNWPQKLVKLLLGRSKKFLDMGCC